MDKITDKQIHWQSDDYIVWDYDYSSLYIDFSLVKKKIWDKEKIASKDIIKVRVYLDQVFNEQELEEKHKEDLHLLALNNIDKVGAMIKD